MSVCFQCQVVSLKLREERFKKNHYLGHDQSIQQKFRPTMHRNSQLQPKVTHTEAIPGIQGFLSLLWQEADRHAKQTRKSKMTQTRPLLKSPPQSDPRCSNVRIKLPVGRPSENLQFPYRMWSLGCHQHKNLHGNWPERDLCSGIPLTLLHVFEPPTLSSSITSLAFSGLVLYLQS